MAFSQQRVFKIARQKPVLKSLLSYSNGIYAGIPNSFVFIDSTLSPWDYFIKIKSLKGILPVTFDSNRITINAPTDDIGDSATVFIYHITKKDTELINVQRMLVKRIPDPVLAINHIPIGIKISKAALLKYKSIDTFMNNDIIGGNDWFKCISFTLNISNLKYDSQSNKLTTEMLNTLKQAPPDIYVVIFNVNVTGPDGKARVMEGWDGKLAQ